eukprot:g2582.t1
MRQDAVQTEDWILDVGSITIGKVIAKGTSAVVAEGNLDGRRVAVKTAKLPSECSDEVLNEMRQEAAMLTRLQHPLIVTFYGLAIDATRVHLVQELCPHTLQDTLRGHNAGQKGRCVHYFSPGGLHGAAAQLCLQLAEGMAFVSAR